MDPAAILADVQLAISLGKTAIELGQDAKPFLLNAYAIAFGNKTLTPDERQAMRDQEAALRASIDGVIAADDVADGAAS